MTLKDAGKGKDYRVNCIKLRNDIEKRLEILGLTSGTVIRIMNTKKSGSVIVKVRGARFAFGKEIAEGIEVSGVEGIE